MPYSGLVKIALPPFATVEHLGDCLGALTGMQLAKFEVLLCSQAADGCCMQKMAVMS